MELGILHDLGSPCKHFWTLCTNCRPYQLPANWAG